MNSLSHRTMLHPSPASIERSGSAHSTRIGAGAVLRRSDGALLQAASSRTHAARAGRRRSEGGGKARGRTWATTLTLNRARNVRTAGPYTWSTGEHVVPGRPI